MHYWGVDVGGRRPADWDILDLEEYPTPGDPDRVRELARELYEFAEDVGSALRQITNMAGDAIAAYWPKLERAQYLADRALKKGREARADLNATQGRTPCRSCGHALGHPAAQRFLAEFGGLAVPDRAYPCCSPATSTPPD